MLQTFWHAAFPHCLPSRFCPSTSSSKRERERTLFIIHPLFCSASLTGDSSLPSRASQPMTPFFQDVVLLFRYRHLRFWKHQVRPRLTGHMAESCKNWIVPYLSQSGSSSYTGCSDGIADSFQNRSMNPFPLSQQYGTDASEAERSRC